MEVMDIIVPIVYAVVGLALIWFIVELVLTIRKVRGKAVETIDELQPTIKKIDPLMDRVTLTVDSVNLEMMRVDEILEDVTQMTGTVSKTLDTVDAVTSAPIDIVNSVTKKVRSKFRPKFASDESVKAGLKGAEPKTNPIADFADTAIDAAGEAFKEHGEKKAERKEALDAKDAKQSAKSQKMEEASELLVNQALENASADTDAPSDDTSANTPNDESAAAMSEGDEERLEGAVETFSDVSDAEIEEIAKAEEEAAAEAESEETVDFVSQILSEDE